MIGSDQVLSEMSSSSLASDALFSVAPPPLAPASLNSPMEQFGDNPHQFEPTTSELAYAKASWLDAIPVDDEPYFDELDGVTAINSDENGLYHMFIGVTP
jgi:hypothetical protein